MAHTYIKKSSDSDHTKEEAVIFLTLIPWVLPKINLVGDSNVYGENSDSGFDEDSFSYVISYAVWQGLLCLLSPVPYYHWLCDYFIIQNV